MLHSNNVKRIDNPWNTKNILFAKNTPHVTDESCCFRCWCWFICSAILHFISIQAVRRQQPRVYFLYGFSCLFCTASLCGITAITLDRLLAIHLHLRYQELVTHKRVVIMVISTWTLSVFLSVMWLWFPLHLSNFITTILAIFFHFLTAMAYFKIYLAVRHHKTQIQSLQVQREAPQPAERANFAGLIKLVIGVFYVYIVLFICYSLTFIFFFIMALNHHGKPVWKIFYFSSSLMFLNSSLNPVIYCWKMRRIRHSIMNIPRQIHDWYRNHFGWYMRP